MFSCYTPYDSSQPSVRARDLERNGSRQSSHVAQAASIVEPGSSSALALHCSVPSNAAPIKLAGVTKSICRAVPSTLAVYIFGSQATGTATPDSDVDIAVLAAEPMTPSTRWELSQTLAIQLGKDVDVVDLRQASTVLRIQVLGTGELLLEVDRAQRQHFEATALGAYARLNDERKGIIADIRAPRQRLRMTARRGDLRGFAQHALATCQD